MKEILENVEALLAIIVEIAMNISKVYSLSVSIISYFLNQLETNEKRETMVKKINFLVYRI